MKADMKLTFWVPFIFVTIVIVFGLIGFDVIDVISIIGVLLIIAYFVAGYIKRKDALVITAETMIVKTPLKTREYSISSIQKVQLSIREGGTIRALYDDMVVTLCTNMYTIPAEEVLKYLLKTFPHIKESHNLRKEVESDGEKTV